MINIFQNSTNNTVNINISGLENNYTVYLINEYDNDPNKQTICTNNTDNFTCEIDTSKTGKYNLQINDTDSIVYKNNNVINVYNIQSVEFFNQSCLNFSLTKIKNFVKVLFDHKIKISNIKKASLDSNHDYLLIYNSYIQYANGNFEVIFDLNSAKELVKEQNYSFYINLEKSSEEWYNPGYNFSFEERNITDFKGIINSTSSEETTEELEENLNYTELKFYGVGSNKIILSGKKNSSYGTLKLIFNHNISNYSVSNFRAKSLPYISVETPFYFENYRNDTRNPRYYHYYNVSGNYSGSSKLEFQMCGNYYQTIPLKFIMKVTDEESNHCLYIQLKIPFFIFLFLFFI